MAWFLDYFTEFTVFLSFLFRSGAQEMKIKYGTLTVLTIVLELVVLSGGDSSDTGNERTSTDGV